jgi:hypothetical protein
MILESAIIPRKPLINRERKRVFLNEANKAVEPLEIVNASFIHHLFNDQTRSFDDIYKEYAEKWIKVVTELRKNNQFNDIYIELGWFRRQYGGNVLKAKT